MKTLTAIITALTTLAILTCLSTPVQAQKEIRDSKGNTSDMTVNGNAVGPLALDMTVTQIADMGLNTGDDCTTQAIANTVERALPTTMALCFAEGRLQRIAVYYSSVDTNTVMGSLEAYYGHPTRETSTQATWALRDTTLTITITAYSTVLSLVSNESLAFAGRNVLNGRALQSSMSAKDWRRATQRQRNW